MRAEREDRKAPPTVLIVEENPQVVETMMQMLDTSHYFFVFAENWKNVVAEARSHRPDCILMNLSLSLLDGNATAQNLKRDKITKDIPIVGFQTPAGEFNWKPADRTRLLQQIDLAVDRTGRQGVAVQTVSAKERRWLS